MPRVINAPNVGQQIARGLAPLIQSLQFRQQQAAQARSQEIAQERNELAEIAQRNLQKERAGDRVMELMQMLGPDILEDPSVAKMVEEAGLRPQTLTQRFQKQRKQVERQQAAAQATALASVPTELRQGMQAFFSAREAGFGQEAATAAMREVFKTTQLSDEARANLAKQYPLLFGPKAGLPLDQALEQLAEIQGARTALAFEVGPDWRARLDRELKQLRLEGVRMANELRRRQLEGEMTPQQSLSLALQAVSFIRQTLSENDRAFLAKFPAQWRQWSFEEKIIGVWGAPMLRALRSAEGIIETQLPDAAEAITGR